MTKQFDIGVAAQKFAVLRTTTLCRVRDKVGLLQFYMRSVFFSYVGASRAYFSDSSHNIFSP
jgi:hypothetical protein